MSDRPRRQHYISRFLLEQWADGAGSVGVVCTYHRESVIVPADKLHWVRSLSSHRKEETWSDLENRAKSALDGLTKSLGAQNIDHEAAQEFLSIPENHEPLIDLARLHHARSLAVPAQQFTRPRQTADSAEAEALIQARWDNAADYHACGIVVTVLSPDAPYALGAVPVFDSESWGGYRPNTARFSLPLTPHLVLSGIPELPAGQVHVAYENINQDVLLDLQLIGEGGWFATPYMICEPSALQQTTQMVLSLTEGRNTHWYALRDRMRLCDNATPQQHADWRQRSRHHDHNQRMLTDATTSNSRKTKILEVMIEDAHKIQNELDALNVPICACNQHRHGELAGLWRRFMPQIICDAMRSKQRGAA